MASINLEKKWVFPLAITSLMLFFLLATVSNMGLLSSLHTISNLFNVFPSRLNHSYYSKGGGYVEQKVSQVGSVNSGPGIPRFAYLVSGSRGDLEKLWRSLHALYHPRNRYVVHLDLESSLQERLELISRIENHTIFSKVRNVYVITKANMVTYRGPTMVSNTLHACAILLKESKDWDWFINLSASDYPLVTQDDLLDTFKTIDRENNFVEHTSHLDWKGPKRAMPLVIDPGLYSTVKEDIFWPTPRRPMPTAFKLFTGSAWMVLSREFVEYLICGWDNLPRTLLMYYSNFVSSPEHYFHTVICNAPEYAKTLINHDLHYISWDNPPKQHPHTLTINDATEMIESGAAFGRKFKENDPVLDRIDQDLLGREAGGFTPGGWCSGNPKCSEVGNPDNIKPGPGAGRLKGLLARLKKAAKAKQNQCK